MTRSEKPAVVLAGMIIAAIYVIMLIGLTRSSYFIGGAALDRARGPVIAVHRMEPESEPPFCTAPQPKVEEPRECAYAARMLHRLLGPRPD